MPAKNFNDVFSNRLRFYLDKYEITQAELAEKLGVGITSVYNWRNGIKTPRMDKIDAMCDLFDCKRSDLIEDKADPDLNDQYYLNDETRQIAREVFENPELRTLFSVARDISPEHLKAYINFMQNLKK